MSRVGLEPLGLQLLSGLHLTLTRAPVHDGRLTFPATSLLISLRFLPSYYQVPLEHMCVCTDLSSECVLGTAASEFTHILIFVNIADRHQFLAAALSPALCLFLWAVLLPFCVCAGPDL